MRVPIRKAEKFTHKKVDPHMTQGKYDELVASLDRAKKRRPQLAKDVQTYAANGDFSENAEYQIAKGKLRGLNQRIIELEEQINKAVIIEHTNTGEVAIGSTVTLAVGDKQKTYQILGSSETNPEKGIISYQSPLGEALMGKKEGEEVAVQIGARKVSYGIIAIE